MNLKDIHVDDCLLVRQWDDMAAEFGTSTDSYWDDDEDNTIDCQFTFVPPMKKFCGMEVVVTKVDDEVVEIRSAYDASVIPSREFSFSADMFEPVPEAMEDLSFEDFDRLLICGFNETSDTGGDPVEA